MMKRLLILLILVVAAACQPTSTATQPPTAPPFPSVTPGAILRAALPPPDVIPLDGGMINPATSVALNARPTNTPNALTCPPPNESATLIETVPISAAGMQGAIETFLATGGTAVALDRDLRSVWNALGGTGFVRADLDLSGEGVAEVIVSLTTPDGGGTLMIFACRDSRYTAVYRESLGGDAPAILSALDMNADGLTDLLISAQTCESGACRVRSQLTGWSVTERRMVNLLSRPLDTDTPLRVEDLDQDRIDELIAEFRDDGSAETGPRRTGFTVYDWDGVLYTSALTQLDPPRYTIQIVFEADQRLADGAYAEAAALYTAALTDTNLLAWQPDDSTALPPYILYRMMIAYSALNDPRRAEVQQAILVQYPDPAAQPVYATAALTFWNAFLITNNVNSACNEVLSIIAARPEALTLLNRYGSESPTYTAQDICPF